MPYRDASEAARERMDQLQAELDRARKERDRVPMLERQLDEARAQLDVDGRDRALGKRRAALALGLLGGLVALGLRALLDTDMLSDVLKSKDPHVLARANA